MDQFAAKLSLDTRWMSDNDEFIREFLDESSESLDLLDQDFVALESNPDDQDRLASVFRTIHTIKGTSGFFNFSKLGAIAHAGENLLGLLRDGTLYLDQEIATALLRCVDSIREVLDQIETTGTEGGGDYRALNEELASLAKKTQPARQPTVVEQRQPLEAPVIEPEVAPSVPATVEVENQSAKEEDAEDDFVREFLEESNENLDLLDQDFVALENEPDDQDRLANVFRTIHTIKGTSGFFNFSKLGAIAHAGEHLLGLLRDGKLYLDQEIASALLECVDSIREVLQQIETTGTEGSANYRALNDRLALLAKKEQSSRPPSTRQALPSRQPPSSQPPSTDQTPSTSQAPSSDIASPITGKGKVAASSGSIRVDVGMLDDLMTLVGELVLARNQLLQLSATTQDRHHQDVTQRVNQITSELQEGIMKTRMQPMGTMWSKFPRVVRDLAVSCGKEVRLVMEGQDTELDRTLLEAIKDPLTHLIRNSVDHGIETPDQRKRVGKDPEGTLTLRSFHEGGLVNIEITDDGGGISVEKVKERAMSRGLLTAEQARKMTDDELVKLIFRPGFSTAQQVTAVSGRGVGMDVVRTNIERIGGSIDLKNRPGKGSTVSVKIPLTLAIIPAMMAECGGQSFAIPQASVIEMLSLSTNESHGSVNLHKSIEYIHETPVVRLRGQILPLVILQRELQLGDGDDHRKALLARETVEVIVLQADQLRFGLVVDSIRNAEEIVVKPLDPVIGALRVYSGAAILGDGNVTLILDISGLASRCLSHSDLKHVKEESVQPQTTESSIQFDDSSLLLCAIDSAAPVALPLDQIRRLEEVESGSLEHSTGGSVMQCRGDIVPLVRLAQTLGRAGIAPQIGDASRPLQVVVTASAGHEVGLVVDSILDVVSCPPASRTLTRTPGLLGQAVINDRVTDIVDVNHVSKREAK